MQIILLEKIANVGNLGDVVKVKDGFARNYLIPQGKAKRATPENLKEIEARRAELEKAANARLTDAQQIAEQLEGKGVQVTQKAGVDGRLFGSVTNADIVEALKAQGFNVEKSMVRLPNGPLKSVGEHPVTVALHSDVAAHITVTVVGETMGNA
jgi:large subunit ribosomal protein L9